MAVPNTKWDITAAELTKCFQSHGLQPQSCISIQCDNCSVKVTTARKLKQVGIQLLEKHEMDEEKTFEVVGHEMFGNVDHFT